MFPLWTVLFTGIAIKSPSSFAWFTTEYFTAALATLMLSMGITLTVDDFKAVLKEPKSVAMQFSLCYLMMPMLALGLGKAFGLESALLAGMVLVGSINGGQASNLCTYIAKGNVALSVLMTTATTVGAICMTPLLCKGLLGAVVPVDAVGIAKSTIQVRTQCHGTIRNVQIKESFLQIALYLCLYEKMHSTSLLFHSEFFLHFSYDLIYQIGCVSTNCYWYDNQQTLPWVCQGNFTDYSCYWGLVNMHIGSIISCRSCRPNC